MTSKLRVCCDVDGVLCACGCGEPTTRKALRLNADFNKFIRGHQHRGWRYYKDPVLVEISPTEKERAWAAEFYEGEGSVIRHRRTLRITISQKNREPLEWLQKRWGGSITGSFPSGSCSIWYLSGGNARRFMADIYPMLSTRRREQADKAGWKV